MNVRAPKQHQQKTDSDRTGSNAEHATTSQRLSLARTIGNQALQRLLQANAEAHEAGSSTSATTQLAPAQSRRPVPSIAPVSLQTKLTVNAPGDIYEQEADSVAARVTSMSESPVQRQCACEEGGGCAECRNERVAHERVQTKRVQANDTGETTAAPPIVHEALGSTSQPLDASTRDFMESRFGHDFSHVRVHTDEKAVESARALKALAYTVGHDVVFGKGQYSPHASEGRRLVAHELTHVLQQPGDSMAMRYGDPIPEVKNPTVVTMAGYIQLVKKVEAANPGLSALQVAQMLMRTKYHSKGWDYLLPSSAEGKQVTASGGVTTPDVTTLTGEFDVTLPQGGKSDASHIVTAIVAAAETSAPGAGGAGGLSGKVIQALPRGVSQRDVATWVGDVASAAAEWATAHPHPKGQDTKQSYMDVYAPESDLIADIDGLAMTSSSSSAGFVFDPKATLSSNMERFYFPKGAREGKNRRFHNFCAVEGLSLEPSGVKLTAAATKSIDERVRLNADWFAKNDPNLLGWVSLNATNALFNPVVTAWIDRADDWQWFSKQFRDFLQRNLNAEGP